MSESVGGSQAGDTAGSVSDGGWGGGTPDASGFSDALDNAGGGLAGEGQTHDAGPGMQTADTGAPNISEPSGDWSAAPTPAPPDDPGGLPAPPEANGIGQDQGVSAQTFQLNELSVAGPEWPEGSLVTQSGDVLVPAWWFADPSRPNDEIVLAQARLPSLPGIPPLPVPPPLSPEQAAALARAIQDGFAAIGREMIGIADAIQDMVVFYDSRPMKNALREAMRIAGLAEPPDWQAHHLVPRGGPQGRARDPSVAQAAMQRAGIPLDSAENGMVLPSAFHRWLHRSPQAEDYYAFVNRTLQDLVSREEVQTGLGLIRVYVHQRYAEWLAQTPPPHPAIGPWP